MTAQPSELQPTVSTTAGGQPWHIINTRGGVESTFCNCRHARTFFKQPVSTFCLEQRTDVPRAAAGLLRGVHHRKMARVADQLHHGAVPGTVVQGRPAAARARGRPQDGVGTHGSLGPRPSHAACPRNTNGVSAKQRRGGGESAPTVPPGCRPPPGRTEQPRYSQPGASAGAPLTRAGCRRCQNRTVCSSRLQCITHKGGGKRGDGAKR
jgi:hypothetical protein